MASRSASAAGPRHQGEVLLQGLRQVSEEERRDDERKKRKGCDFPGPGNEY